MEKIDFEYEVTEEQVRRFRQIPLIDRLRWVEEICIFTNLARHAPVATPSDPSLKSPQPSHHKQTTR
jgi:hypothetical protein